MSNIRLKTITIDTIGNNFLYIKNGAGVYITNTTNSLNSSIGSLICSGGISIQSSSNATSATWGGGITNLGGMSNLGDVFLGGNLRLDTTYGTVRINGDSNPRLFIDTIVNKSITISPGGNSNGVNLSDTALNVNYNASSSNSSTGGMVISGGISINNGINSSSITQGGGLTINGGIGFSGDAFCGSTINSNVISTSSLISTSVTLTNIFATNTSITNISASTLQMSGQASIANLVSMNASITNISANSLQISGNGSISTLLSINSSIVNLMLTNTSITNISASTLQMSGQASIANLVSTNTSITNISANTLQISGQASIANLVSTNTSITNISANSLQVSGTGNISNLISINSSISNLTLGTLKTTDTSHSFSTGGSITFSGGLTILDSQNSIDVNNGGCLSLLGGLSVKKDIYIGGDVNFLSATPSTNSSTGAAIFAGGVGIDGRLNVKGDTLLYGNLTVNGTTTNIYTSNTILQNNILTFQAGSSGARDAGMIIKRYQTENSIGSGDVITDVVDLANARVVNVSSGSLSSPTTQVIFDNTTSVVDGFYNGWWLNVYSGAATNQVRLITGYTGSSHIASIQTAWDVQPSSGDQIKLFNRPSIGLIFDELEDIFILGSSVQDTLSNSFANIIFTELVPLKTAYQQIYGSYGFLDSVSNTSAALYISGGISLDTTTDATSILSGGALTTPGGGAFGKTLYCGALNVNGINITPNTSDILSSSSFTGGNNTNGLITGLTFSNTNTWSFDIFLSSRIIASTNRYSNFHLRGIQKASTWDLTQNYIGDDSFITFGINASGAVSYTSANYAGFTSLIMRFKAITN